VDGASGQFCVGVFVCIDQGCKNTTLSLLDHTTVYLGLAMTIDKKKKRKSCAGSGNTSSAYAYALLN